MAALRIGFRLLGWGYPCRGYVVFWRYTPQGPLGILASLS